MLAEAVAAEAAKVVTAEVVGVSIRGGQRLLRILRDKLGALSRNRDELTRQVLAAAVTDPDWWVRVQRGVAVQNEELLPGTYQALPPVPFFDRAQPLSDAPTAGVYVIGGQRGSGRTALARQIAYMRRASFPAGVIEIDLDCHRVEGMLQHSAVRTEVLGWLGIRGDDVAVPAGELRQQYASATVTREFVLILCHVRGLGEVTPFVTRPDNLVLATTSNLSYDLCVDYPHTRLGPLDHAGALALLAARCGEGVVTAEPDAADQLLELCGFLPDAIRHVAVALARRAGRPTPVATLLAELSDGGVARRFGPVRAALTETIAALPPDVQDAAALLAAHPAPGFSDRSAEALLGRGAGQVVERLDDAGLLVDVGSGRHQLHGLAQDYLAGQVDGDDAFDLILTYCRDLAVAADRQLDEDGQQRLRRYPQPLAPARPLPDGVWLDWLDGERALLQQIVREAHRRGRHQEVCQLAGALEVLVTARGGWPWYAALNESATSSAAELGDTACLARTHAMQGRAYTQLQVFDRARVELGRAEQLVATLPADPQLKASLLEFTARYHQEVGETGAAVTCFWGAVEIDRETDDRRALGIHARMLANALLDTGRETSFERIDELLRVAEDASEGRNIARVLMVRARRFLREGRLDEAARQLAQAGDWVSAERWTSYREELDELRVELLCARGETAAAIAVMDALVDHAFVTGHPKAHRYLDVSARLRS